MNCFHPRIVTATKKTMTIEDEARTRRTNGNRWPKAAFSITNTALGTLLAMARYAPKFFCISNSTYRINVF